jgi:hypothetical protein
MISTSSFWSGCPKIRSGAQARFPLLAWTRISVADFDVRKNEGESKRVPRAFFTAITPRFIRRQTFDVTWMPWSVAQMLNKLVRIGAPPPGKPKLSERDDLRLQAILKSDVEALRAYLKDPLPEWRPYA